MLGDNRSGTGTQPPWEFCKNKKNISLYDYVMEAPFSQFLALGFRSWPAAGPAVARSSGVGYRTAGHAIHIALLEEKAVSYHHRRPGVWV